MRRPSSALGRWIEKSWHFSQASNRRIRCRTRWMRPAPPENIGGRPPGMLDMPMVFCRSSTSRTTQVLTEKDPLSDADHLRNWQRTENPTLGGYAIFSSVLNAA